jgi:hypothetical protein
MILSKVQQKPLMIDLAATHEDVMEERRRVQRTRVLRAATIIFNHRSSTIDCVVRNLTNVGARLHVASTAGIPANFALTFDGGRSSRACRMVWSRDDRLGVIFE